MKKIYLSLTAIICTLQFCNAQWTTSGSNIYFNSGNVGIGLTNPTSKLAISGNSSGYTGADLSISRSTSLSGVGNSPVLQFNDLTTGYGSIIQSYQGQLQFFNNTGSSWLECMRITGNGNVGIGTTTPITTLHLMGTFVASGTSANIGYTGALNTNFLANTGEMLIAWNRTFGSGETDFISNQGSGFTGGFAFYNHDNSNNENQLMWLQGNGNLLIGKTTQANTSYKLDVNGNVRANQVVINTTGADFVFAPNYHLNSLANVKKYIDKNHHLPEIASAKEMQTNGLNVGENQTRLLQKVEELTLYLIEEDKQIAVQQQLNSKQQQELDTQRQEIDELKKLVAGLIKVSKAK